MKVVFRADAGTHIGYGHIMRCLTLAGELKRHGAEILFITRDFRVQVEQFIGRLGYSVTLLPKIDLKKSSNDDDNLYEQWLGVPWNQDVDETAHELGNNKVDWLIVDHYGIDRKWQEKIRNHVYKIMVIDDLANREHDCNLLLDQTYGRSKNDYQSYVGDACEVLAGSKYALIRNDFARLRMKALKKRTQFKDIKHILVSMGGVDKDNVTSIVLKALNKLDWDPKPCVDVVLTKAAPHLELIKQQSSDHKLNVRLHISTSDMAELMLDADLAIGAPGTTSWERCCLGLPTISIKQAENQNTISKQLDELGAHISLNTLSENTENELISKLNSLYRNKKAIIDLSTASSTVCDGIGAARVGLEIAPVFSRENKKITLHEATMDNAEQILEWQSYPLTRKYSNNPKAPEKDEHFRWLKKKLCSNTDYFWIIMHDGEPSGVLRLDYLADMGGYLVSIFIAPNKYRLGIASGALTIAKRLFSWSDIYAQIKPENTASAALFESAGFIKSSNEMYFLKTNS